MMRISIWGFGLASLSLAAPICAQATAPKAPCVTEQEVSALAVYTLPQLLAATRASCGARLSPNGFLATGADAMAQRYAALKPATWPLAKSALLKLAASKDKPEATTGDDPLAAVSTMPDNALQPFVDAFIQQEVAKSIKPISCRPIERVAKALAPLDPSDAGTLIGVIAGLALADNKDMPVCPAEP